MSLAARTWVALVHHPVHDRRGDIVSTSVTNLDIHDIARSSRTYGLAGYLLVTPIERQRELVQKVVDAWTTPQGQLEHPSRAAALGLTRVTPSIEGAIEWIRGVTGTRPEVTVTAARTRPEYAAKAYTYGAWTRAATDRTAPQLILFGTGWGLADPVLQAADRILLPIQGKSDYNHLSVRAAVAIILDRLLGDRAETGDA